MHLVLSLPGLLAPGAERGAPAPHLARLLSQAISSEREADGLDAALAVRYGIARARDWPLAPIRAAALGVATAGAYWLRADPVTLEAGRDDVRLAGPVLDLDSDAASGVIAALNAHFASDAIAFVAPRPDAWFVRAERPVALATRPLALATGRMLRDLLPAGPDAGTWGRWQNEIEMLLHAHPVNAAREAAGRAPANGVWLSEGGALPPRPTHHRFATFADGGLAIALAAHAGAPASPLPASFDSVLANAGGADTLIVALAAPFDLASVEAAWAAPARSALVQGRLDTVTTIADGGEDGAALACTVRRPAPWRRLVDALARPDFGRVRSALGGA